MRVACERAGQEAMGGADSLSSAASITHLHLPADGDSTLLSSALLHVLSQPCCVLSHTLKMMETLECERRLLHLWDTSLSHTLLPDSSCCSSTSGLQLFQRPAPSLRLDASDGSVKETPCWLLETPASNSHAGRRQSPQLLLAEALTTGTHTQTSMTSHTSSLSQ